MLPQAAGAAGTVAIGSATRSGDTLTVTGTSTYTDQPFVELGTDGTGDTFLPGQDVMGADLTAAFISTRANNQLQIRWQVASLPPNLNGSPTGIAYGASFCVNEAQCWDVDAQRMGLGAGSTNPVAYLWTCGDPTCAPAQQTNSVSLAAPVFDATARTITATVGLGQIGATPGSKITPSAASTDGPWFVWVGDATVSVNSGLADGVPEIAEYTVPGKQVSVAVGAPGLDPASVTYGTTVTPSGTGAYSAAVNVAGLSGDQAVYVRACLGEGNCAYATQAVTL